MPRPDWRCESEPTVRRDLVGFLPICKRRLTRAAEAAIDSQSRNLCRKFQHETVRNSGVPEQDRGAAGQKRGAAGQKSGPARSSSWRCVLIAPAPAASSRGRGTCNAGRPNAIIKHAARRADHPIGKFAGRARRWRPAFRADHPIGKFAVRARC